MVINQTIAGIILVLGFFSFLAQNKDLAVILACIAIFISLDTVDDHHQDSPKN